MSCTLPPLYVFQNANNVFVRKAAQYIAQEVITSDKYKNETLVISENTIKKINNLFRLMPVRSNKNYIDLAEYVKNNFSNGKIKFITTCLDERIYIHFIIFKLQYNTKKNAY